MGPTALKSEENLTGFSLIVLLLSVVVLLILVVNLVVKLPKEVAVVLQRADTVICFVLFADFWIRLWRAERRLEFMKWGWIDLIACIPNVEPLRIGRVVRLLRILQLVRGVRSFQRIVNLVTTAKPRSALASILVAVFLLITFSSVSILICEDEPTSNIKTAEDAIWWSVTTITTVGYGDKYPVTFEGRIVAMVLMVSGVGVFGTLSGVIASTFVTANKAPESHLDEILREIRALKAEIETQYNAQPTPGQNRTR